jgi:hypothetical protein
MRSIYLRLLFLMKNFKKYHYTPLELADLEIKDCSSRVKLEQPVEYLPECISNFTTMLYLWVSKLDSFQESTIS